MKLWEGVVYTLFLTSLSSCTQSHSQWKRDSINTTNPEYCSERLLYVDNSAQVEFLNIGNTTRCTFNVTSLPLVPLHDTPSTGVLTLTINDQEEKVLVHILEGNQKAIIPETTTAKIINALKENEVVTIQTGRYTVKLSPSNV